MPKTKEKKREVISKLEEKVKNQKAMIFVNFQGLKMDDFSELREGLKKSEAELVVTKKTLLNIAFNNNRLGIDIEKIKGEMAVIFGFGDQIGPAKIAYDFSQKKPNLKLTGGFIEGILRNENEIATFAQLPSREELLVKFVRTLQAPLSNLTSVLGGNIRKFIYLLKQVKS